ncbi:MAG: hypothetical protein EPN37_17100 [Chitinophagaceae bacterium]|nr:MAG: hypothetical protein EPN37_17100 [Chitinophagaceae bacterium]
MKPSVTFLAFYFSDLGKIEEVVNSENDLTFTFPFPEGYYHWSPLKEITITAGEIVQMTLDAWFDCKEMKTLTHYPEIHPKEIYERTLLVKEWLEEFMKEKLKEMEYEKYYKFIYALDEDWEWIDEEEMQEFLKEGYRKIDLELINFSQKRNNTKVKELLREGANPNIDPADKMEESEILDFLISKSSFQSLSYDPCFTEFEEKRYDGFQDETEYRMISYLYGVASSDELYRTIIPFSKLAH